MTTSPPQNVTGLVRREELEPQQRDEMFALLSSHFESVTRDQFEHDLAEKNWVVEIRRNGTLSGFSTLLATPMQFDGRWLTAIYSGDTIVAPDAWGSPNLARTWIAAVNQLRAAFPGQPCYWLLLTSGFRTYRFLPLFWREFFPRHDGPTPPEKRLLLNYLAEARYGDLFDPIEGIVRFVRPQRLRGPLREIPSGRESDPNVAFFLDRNPGHVKGDELVCLTEISETNLTPAGWRMVASR